MHACAPLVRVAPMTHVRVSELLFDRNGREARSRARTYYRPSSGVVPSYARTSTPYVYLRVCVCVHGVPVYVANVARCRRVAGAGILSLKLPEKGILPAWEGPRLH